MVPTTSTQMEASTSRDSLEESPAMPSCVADISSYLLEPSSAHLRHPVTNKSIPPTAIVITHVAKVSTPGCFPPTDHTESVDTEDTGDNVSSSESEDEAAPKTYMTQKRKITRRTTGVKRNNFITRVFEIYFNLCTNH